MEYKRIIRIFGIIVYQEEISVKNKQVNLSQNDNVELMNYIQKLYKEISRLNNKLK